MEITILKEYEDTETFVEIAQESSDENRHSFGFLPSAAYLELAIKGKLWIAVDESQKYLGHLMIGGKAQTLKVKQLMVLEEYRSCGVGRQLIDEFEEYGKTHGYHNIKLRVRSDLRANEFWEKNNYLIISQESSPTEGKCINVRVKDLGVNSLFGVSELYTFYTPLVKKTIQFNQVLSNNKYVIDLNVFWDLIKGRQNVGVVRELISLSMSSEIDLCVSSEFSEELNRTKNAKSSEDIILSFANSLPTLPSVPDKCIDNYFEEIIRLVFPHKSSAFSKNDESDIRHLCMCIHHGVAGFITSEKAMLKANSVIKEKYGLEILSPHDFADYYSDNENDNIKASVSIGNTNLKVFDYDENYREEVKAFLTSQGVSNINESLDPGTSTVPKKRLLVKSNGTLIGYFAWHTSNNTRKVQFYLNEDESSAIQIIDHILELNFRTLPYKKFLTLKVCTLESHYLTSKTLEEKGFTQTEKLGKNLVIFSKLCYFGFIEKDGWSEFKTEVEDQSSLIFQDELSDYEDLCHTGLITENLADSGKTFIIKLHDLETMLSPLFILAPNRDAVVLPIKKKYAEELLPDYDEQYSLFPSKEVSLHLERTYYRSTKKAKSIKEGMPVVFYVSGDGGMKAIGMARVRRSEICTVDEAEFKYSRQGVLERPVLNEIADSDNLLHAFTFDNFIKFHHYLSFKWFKEKQIVDGLNFTTFQKISSCQLTTILKEAFND
ncbi:MAG: GNAT family N-acetyltransferase [Lentisphaeraceae bacterium]|nr:GNAT family N-acetyltransferase [Lentisphaeraceae bacterium]